jgi:tripartite ATP-independent transporter DctM subunit
MEPFTLGLIGVTALIILLLMGMQVAYAGALVGTVGLILLLGWESAVGAIGIMPYEQLSVYPLSVLPMFILIGFLAFHANLTQGAFHAMRMWFGWAPGGLAVATVFSAAAFAAVSGSSTSTAAIFSRVAIPEMLKNGYNRGFAAGVVAAGGTLASLIPPSGILVIYAIIVEESVGRLLLAGFIPGVLSAIIYAISIVIRAKLNRELAAPIERVQWGERLKSTKDLWGILAVVGVILGGIYSGRMSPVESGAVGAFIILILAIFNKMTWPDFKTALGDAARISIMVLTIIWCILILVRFLGYSGLPAQIENWVTSLTVDRFWILIVILLMYTVLGMFIDAIGMLLLTLPLVHPIVMSLGYDPIWFGIIVVKMVEIGLITPPIGINVFVVSGVRPDIPLGEIFRGIWWFFVCDVATVALLIAYPQIVLWLPNNMLGG